MTRAFGSNDTAVSAPTRVIVWSSATSSHRESAPVLIISGARNTASVLARAASGFGIDPSRIQRIDTALDTEDESHAVRALVGDAPVALVTSAAHMPRAAALFRAAGVRALPCPVDYTGDYNPDFRWNGLNWDADSLGRSTWAVRERLGALWLRLRGKIQ